MEIWLLKVGICFEKRSKAKEQSCLGFVLKRDSAEREWEKRGLATAILLKEKRVVFYFSHSFPLSILILKSEICSFSFLIFVNDDP